MKRDYRKNLVLAALLACFFYNGQQICLNPQGGGVDTGNPKGEPTSDDPTKPVILEKRLDRLKLLLPGQLMGEPLTGAPGSLADGGHELGPKVIKRV